MKLQSNFIPKNDPRHFALVAINCWSGKQQQIAIRIFDYEIFGAPRLFFQSLVKSGANGLEFKKQQLDLDCRGDGHRC